MVPSINVLDDRSARNHPQLMLLEHAHRRAQSLSLLGGRGVRIGTFALNRRLDVNLVSVCHDGTINQCSG
jgi:hypothetical protein